MSSIDDVALGAATAALFDALTAGAAPPASGQAPFPMGPDPQLPSYYLQRGRPAMAREDFLSASCLDAGEFGQRLAACWLAAGRPALAAQAPLAAETAAALHALYVQARPQAELSPYIYQMF
jgi:hypothetical protein